MFNCQISERTSLWRKGKMSTNQKKVKSYHKGVCASGTFTPKLRHLKIMLHHQASKTHVYIVQVRWTRQAFFLAFQMNESDNWQIFSNKSCSSFWLSSDFHGVIPRLGSGGWSWWLIGSPLTTINYKFRTSFRNLFYKLSKNARSLSNALNRWLIPFFSSLLISAYVFSHPLGWNTGSHPNVFGPLAGTISPYQLTPIRKD